MKKTISIILALFVLISCAGCGKKDTNIEVSDHLNKEIASEFSLPSDDFEDPEILPDVSSEPVEKTNANISSLDGTKQGWGVGSVNFDEGNRPASCLDFQNVYGKYNADFIKENTNKIYLTFDEGYEAGYTAGILDSLKEKNVSAVFFITYDYASRNQELVRRMIDEGHILGNHTYSHPSMPEISVASCVDEIVKLDTFVQETYQVKMSLIRPPMGEFSERTLAVTQNLDYRSVFWSFAYKDWDTKNQPEATASLKKMVDRLHNGAIYLLHAVSKTNATVLEEFIDQSRTQGFEFAKYE